MNPNEAPPMQISHLDMSTQNLRELEKSVETAGTQLANVTDKLYSVETILNEAIDSDGTADESVAVLTLLENMTEVNNEYQNLRKDILEVQQLQREMKKTLSVQRQRVVQTFRILKRKFETRNAMKQQQ